MLTGQHVRIHMLIYEISDSQGIYKIIPVDLQDLAMNETEVNLPDTLVVSDWSVVPSLIPSISPLTIISELLPTSRVSRLG